MRELKNMESFKKEAETKISAKSVSGEKKNSNELKDAKNVKENINIQYDPELYNLGEIICYEHKKGTPVDIISEITPYDKETIEELVEEAKRSDLYDYLADKIKVRG